MQGSTTTSLLCLDHNLQEKVRLITNYSPMGTYIQIISGTLLNRLFGTTFGVMDETKRQQTTKGTRFIASSSKMVNYVHRNMDV